MTRRKKGRTGKGQNSTRPLKRIVDQQSRKVGEWNFTSVILERKRWTVTSSQVGEKEHDMGEGKL